MSMEGIYQMLLCNYKNEICELLRHINVFLHNTKAYQRLWYTQGHIDVFGTHKDISKSSLHTRTYRRLWYTQGHINVFGTHKDISTSLVHTRTYPSLRYIQGHINFFGTHNDISTSLVHPRTQPTLMSLWICVILWSI